MRFTKWASSETVSQSIVKRMLRIYYHVLAIISTNDSENYLVWVDRLACSLDMSSSENVLTFMKRRLLIFDFSWSDLSICYKHCLFSYFHNAAQDQTILERSKHFLKALLTNKTLYSEALILKKTPPTTYAVSSFISTF